MMADSALSGWARTVTVHSIADAIRKSAVPVSERYYTIVSAVGRVYGYYPRSEQSAIVAEIVSILGDE